jgi:5-formyltetrahydrofolate cyclo-ligase
LALKKLISIPQFKSEQGEYIACRFDKPEEELVRGKHGILEPPANSPVVPLNQLDLVLVPGVAFDLHGRRLGRGYGYYDRLLDKVCGIKCGVAFDQQIKAELPEEPHDARLDCILTPTRWLSFSRRAVLE